MYFFSVQDLIREQARDLAMHPWNAVTWSYVWLACCVDYAECWRIFRDQALEAALAATASKGDPSCAAPARSESASRR